MPVSGLSLVEVEPSTVEVDRRREALSVAAASSLALLRVRAENKANLYVVTVPLYGNVLWLP